MPESQVPQTEDRPGSAHGNTPAAWAAVVVGLVAFVVGGIGLMFDPINYVIFYIGVGLVVVAGVVFVVMDRLGFGAGQQHHTDSDA